MLELEHLQKSFDGVPVLKDISLQVEDGEIVSILGPSGCGKTTLLNMILGIVDADQGAIRYNGEDLTHTPWRSGASTSSFRTTPSSLI